MFDAETMALLKRAVAWVKSVNQLAEEEGRYPLAAEAFSHAMTLTDVVGRLEKLAEKEETL